MPEPCDFVFDAVIIRYALRNFKLQDPKKVIVEANLNSKIVSITSSRHNITEFKNDSRFEFTEDPKKLREALDKNGLPIAVKYGNRLVGQGLMHIPQAMIDRIEIGMTDLLHSDNIKLERNNENAGTLELLFRLVIKCNEPTTQEQQECRQNMDKSISPQDILFLMGDTQHCPNPSEYCPDVWEQEEGDEPLKLDLQRYQSMNSTWNPAKSYIENTSGKGACSELKQMTRECIQIVDSITQGVGQSLPQGPADLPPENPYVSLSSGHRNRRLNSTPPAEDKLNVTPFPNFTYLPTNQKDNNVVCQPGSNHVPISDINKPDIKPTRFCPVCLTNMSWLPKFAACPKCGVKPMPLLEERHKEKKLTAEQILIDYLGKPPQTLDKFCETVCEKKQREEEQQTECRCTCKFGKLCAHCRIKKLCADIFQSDETTQKCFKIKPKSSDDFCTIMENSEECRPYLSRVFSELRDLYNVKNTRRLSEPDKVCGEMTIQTPEQNQKQSKVVFKGKAHKETPFDDQRSKIKPKPIEKKPRVGHKHCVEEKMAVSRHHGWDWKSSKQFRKYGWRPGYILKPIHKLMKFFLHYLPEDNAYNVCKRREAEEQRHRKNLQPILNVTKKNGEIFVTLRPANDTNIEMQPITFKIVKSEKAVAIREIKKTLKAKGFRKCTCHRTLMMCICRNHMEKSHLGQALQKECHRRGMENCVNQLVLTDTSESEMEFDIDVSPPAGTVKPLQLLKRRQVNSGTQTAKKDLIVQPMFPAQISPYWRSYDCAVGDRYTATAFGTPGEAVYEDGFFGRKGGGLHGDPSPGGSEGRAGRAGRAGLGARRGREGFADPVDKLFPADKGKGGKGGKGGGKNAAIAVKMPKRFKKSEEMAKKAKVEAEKLEQKKRKMGINMMKYLQKHGMGKGKGMGAGKPIIGPDGLTAAQRRRRMLLAIDMPSIDDVPQKGKGYNPCTAQCYNPCAEYCTPFGYTC